MDVKYILLCHILLITVCSCTTKRSIAETHKSPLVAATTPAKISRIELKSQELANSERRVENNTAIHDTTFVDLKRFSTDFVYNMKYATSDNFLNEKVYDCASCFLRYKTVKSLIKANEKFKEKGYRIMLYDCYRPLSIQQKMFALVPNPKYVADPKKGSIHNRGGAVDISLVDSKGNELDMGTAFDFFGVEASHDYRQLSDEVLANRKLLRRIMTQNNFKIFDSEWWHYNIKNAQKEPVSNSKWNCD